MSPPTPAVPGRPPAAAARAGLPLGNLGSWTIFAAVMLTLWEIGARLYAQPYLVPAPTAIFRELRDNTGLVMSYAGITTTEVILGFAIGSALALLGAMAFVWLPKLIEEFLFRVVVTLNSTPFVALASLAVVWFGLGIRSRVIIAAMYTFFAVLYTTHKEFVSVERIREQLMDGSSGGRPRTTCCCRCACAIGAGGCGGRGGGATARTRAARWPRSSSTASALTILTNSPVACSSASRSRGR
jgi:hypothetical protein